jgi:hypothetical protein
VQVIFQQPKSSTGPAITYILEPWGSLGAAVAFLGLLLPLYSVRALCAPIQPPLLLPAATTPVGHLGRVPPSAAPPLWDQSKTLRHVGLACRNPRVPHCHPPPSTYTLQYHSFCCLPCASACVTNPPSPCTHTTFVREHWRTRLCQHKCGCRALKARASRICSSHCLGRPLSSSIYVCRTIRGQSGSIHP